MPHYKDGTQAQVGDYVRGKPYNTPHEVAGTVVSITPNTGCCNMLVALIAKQVRCSGLTRGVMLYRAEDHGSKGELGTYEVATDYGAIGDFEIVARPGKATP